MVYDLLLERFLRYVKINTRSDENATRTPTTQSQVDFALKVLKPELEELGLSNIHYLESNGYLVATLPANDDQLTRKIGFISHMDTADFNAEGVSPQVIDSYDGGIIPLGNSGYNLDPADFPNLKNYVGQTLITTDGTTLLGADDKSGIAEIMTALAYLKAHPEIKHCEIRVGFGPDEEIGIGADKFDVEDFDVNFATQLTVDLWVNYSMKPSLQQEQNLPSTDVMFILEQQKTKWLMPCSWQLIFIISCQQKNALS